MNTKVVDANSRKQTLLEQLNKIQSKIDNLEKQKADRVSKLAKKHQIIELDEKIIEQEFLLIKEKYSALIEENESQGKKN